MEIIFSFLSVPFIPGLSFTFCCIITYRYSVQSGRRCGVDIQLLRLKTGNPVSVYALLKAPAGIYADDGKGF